MNSIKIKKHKPSDNPWFLYILECCDNSLYTGITNRLTIRIDAHKAGTGARYTRSHLPVKLVYVEECQNRSSASKREWAEKKMSKSQKLELIKMGSGFNNMLLLRKMQKYSSLLS